jgi:hypothetical protein
VPSARAIAFSDYVGEIMTKFAGSPPPTTMLLTIAVAFDEFGRRELERQLNQGAVPLLLKLSREGPFRSMAKRMVVQMGGHGQDAGECRVWCDCPLVPGGHICGGPKYCLLHPPVDVE